MNAKKIWICLLAVCLVLASFSACGDQNKSNQEIEQTIDAPVDTTPVEIEDAGVDFCGRVTCGTMCSTRTAG